MSQFKHHDVAIDYPVNIYQPGIKSASPAQTDINHTRG